MNLGGTTGLECSVSFLKRPRYNIVRPLRVYRSSVFGGWRDVMETELVGGGVEDAAGEVAGHGHPRREREADEAGGQGRSARRANGKIEAEVRRYATWPGQACGYKCGELELLRLRRKFEAAAAPRSSPWSTCRTKTCSATRHKEPTTSAVSRMMTLTLK